MSGRNTRDVLKLQSAVVEVELLGEKFITARAKMMELDKKRNGTRQALTSIRKHHEDNNVYLVNEFGFTVRAGKQQAATWLEEDQKQIEAEVGSTRKEVKRLTALLADKGATPEEIGPGLLGAMLNLKGGQEP